MASRITPQFKEQVLARIDILDVVGSRLSLRRAGELYKACCPFHQEKTPSFTVTPARQTYHCFGCGAHGNAIDFLIEHDRLSFREALKELAHQAGILMPEPDRPDALSDSEPDHSPLYEVLEEAAALYRQQIREHPPAIDYLKGRGLTGEIALEFGLGFAPPGWDFLINRLGTDPARLQALLDAGLVVERTSDGNDRRYDRFRNRIMFPIRDRRGRVIAFGGRVLDQSEPKYLNSPETPIFHKGGELYGLYELRRRRHRGARVLIVEGYMDVIALTQFGVPYAVATLGTATTADQLGRLKRQAGELVFCFDGDKAGRAAAWKALRISLPLVSERLTIRFLLLPAGHDPDSLVRADGLAGFEARLEQALLLSDYLFQELRQGADLNSAEGRVRCDAEARELIALAPEGTFRQLLLQRLADLVGIQHEPLPQVSASRRDPPVRPRAPVARRTPLKGNLTPARLAAALLLRQPGLSLIARDLPGSWMESTEPGVDLLRELLAHADADPDITPAMVEEIYRGARQEPDLRALNDPGLTDHIPRQGVEHEFTGALTALSRLVEQERRYRWLSGVSPGRLTAEGGLPRGSGSDSGWESSP